MNTEPAPHPRAQRTSQRMRYRVEQLDTDHFAVVERLTRRVIIDGFHDYGSAWSFIANRLLDGRHA